MIVLATAAAVKVPDSIFYNKIEVSDEMAVNLVHRFKIANNIPEFRDFLKFKNDKWETMPNVGFYSSRKLNEISIIKFQGSSVPSGYNWVAREATIYKIPLEKSTVQEEVKEIEYGGITLVRNRANLSGIKNYYIGMVGSNPEKFILMGGATGDFDEVRYHLISSIAKKYNHDWTELYLYFSIYRDKDGNCFAIRLLDESSVSELSRAIIYKY